ncbi:hypothetical protein E2C01_071086 [Portunus trituberculatus]|uniref:Uncharacterized protein n=1 Tax=Portunus trituberculatus TaxID=210409 RepID=A0A5B7HZ31_PORTR|nr:hypothetical protein [Portunus trituberculatus]
MWCVVWSVWWRWQVTTPAVPPSSVPPSPASRHSSCAFITTPLPPLSSHSLLRYPNRLHHCVYTTALPPAKQSLPSRHADSLSSVVVPPRRASPHTAPPALPRTLISADVQIMWDGGVTTSRCTNNFWHQSQDHRSLATLWAAPVCCEPREGQAAAAASATPAEPPTPTKEVLIFIPPRCESRHRAASIHITHNLHNDLHIRVCVCV